MNLYAQVYVKIIIVGPHLHCQLAQYFKEDFYIATVHNHTLHVVNVFKALTPIAFYIRKSACVTNVLFSTFFSS